MTSTPPGWFPDPLGRHEHRWFNGTTWTSDVADGGMRSVDPLGTSPSPVPATSARNGFATAGLVCGIVGVLLAWVPFVVVIGATLAVLALIFGAKGLRAAGPDGPGRGRAIAGVVTGGVGVLLSIVGVVLSVALFRAVDDFLEPGPHQAEIAACVVEDRVATVSGTLTNRSDATRDYNVFARVGDRDGIVTVTDVGPGETVRWDVDVRRVDEPSPCFADLDVRGPFPFGIELDRDGR